jgi:threonine synthase
MDILISSNLERLLYHVSGNNSSKVKGWMDELNTKGQYQVEKQYLDTIQEVFWADWASDSEAMDAISKVFKQYRYVLDPHTAVAWEVCEKYKKQTGDKTPNIIVSTASPFKFNESVLEAIAGKEHFVKQTEFALLDRLSELTGWSVPKGLAELKHKAVLHHETCDKNNMQDIVQKLLVK